jgi:hypothetical protein
MTLTTGIDVLAGIQSAAAGSAGAILSIERVEATQSGTATSAQTRLALGQRTIAGTLTVTSATPNPIVLGGPASGIAGNTALGTGTARCGVNGSADSTGTYTNTYVCAPNNLGGFLWIATPEQRLIVPPSTMFVARFLADPSSLSGWTITVLFEEVF